MSVKNKVVSLQTQTDAVEVQNVWIVSLLRHGEMAERSIAAVLKTVDLRGSGGSNPSLSAKNIY